MVNEGQLVYLSLRGERRRASHEKYVVFAIVISGTRPGYYRPSTAKVPLSVHFPRVEVG